MKKYVYLFLFSSFISCSTEIEKEHVVRTRCLNKDGIVVDCIDTNNPKYFLENMQTKSLVDGWDREECTLNGGRCKGFRCFKSKRKTCNNTSGSTECVVCANCGNPPDCLSSF